MSDSEATDNKQQCCYCCYNLCGGNTPWYISMLVFPFVLLWNCIRVFLWPCVYVLCGTCLEIICCFCCRKYCIDRYLYEDEEFALTNRSLALVDPPRWDPLNPKNERFKSSVLKDLDKKKEISLKITKIDWEENDDSKDDDLFYRIQWLRASEIASNSDGKTYMFHDGIEPNDVAQGKLGNCWLLAAIASLAEFPGAIENCFITYGTNPRHKYKIRLYDARKNRQRWETVTIDDFIPVQCTYATMDDRTQSINPLSKHPVFATPKGNEMWVLLLEKAFAKFCGSYSELSGGHAMWAMQAITGDYCCRWEYNNASLLEDGVGKSNEKRNCWKKYKMEYLNSKSRNPKKDWKLKRCRDNETFYENQFDTNNEKDHDNMWELIKKYDEMDSLIVASVMKKSGQVNEDSLGETGLIVGHTYTVNKVKEFNGGMFSGSGDDVHLLRMRNPWGQKEWEQEFGDNDPRWKEERYKKIYEYMMTDKGTNTVNTKHEDDGTFLISRIDFFKYFNVIQICHRSTIRDLCLTIEEENGSCGVLKGCFCGCCKYWCCQGCGKIYCGSHTSEDTIDTRNCCQKCCAK